MNCQELHFVTYQPVDDPIVAMDDFPDIFLI